MTKKVRTYSDEFKAEAVKKISDNNGNISATAKHLVSYFPILKSEKSLDCLPS